MPHTVNLSDWIAERRNADPWLSIEVEDGDPVVIPDPILWPEPGDDDTNDDLAAKTIGAEEYARFKANGGTWTILLALVRERGGLDLGE